jgi:hypothetical protein
MGYSDDLVNLGMKVCVIVDAVAPGVLPPVTSKQNFKQRSGIGGPDYPDRAAIENERQLGIRE